MDTLPQHIKNVIAQVSTGNNPYFVGIEKFLAIILGRRVPVRPASQAKTSGDVIYLPPQELDDEGKLIYLGKALHEVSHILIGSDFGHYQNIQRTHKHGVLIAHLINIVDDIRVEQGLQKLYPRVVKTTRSYWLWKEKNILPSLDEPHTLQKDLLTLILNVGVLFIARCRFRQLDLTMSYQPHPLVTRVYDEYFKSLEEEAIAQDQYQDSVALAFKLYKRIRDMIQDNVQTPKEKHGNNGQDNQGPSSGACGNPGEKSNDTSKNDGDTGEPSNGSESDPKNDKPTQSSARKDNSDDDSPSGGDESKESDGDTGSNHSRNGDDEDTENNSGSTEGSSDSDETSEQSENTDPSHGKNSEDTGDSEESSEDRNEQGAGPQNKSNESDDTLSEGEGDESRDESRDAEEDSDGEESSVGPEESTGESSEDEGEEDQNHSVGKEIKKQIDASLSALQADKLQTPDALVTRSINQGANSTDEYYVHPNVRDQIVDGYEGDKYTAQRIKTEGIALLGRAGKEMLRHFVSQTKPRIIRRQRSGRFDNETFLRDRYSQDIFSEKMRGALERSAVAIALDNSGSMVRGKKDIIASQLISGMLYHMDRVNIPTLAAGYTTARPTMPISNNHRFFPVRIDIIKRFEERYSSQTARRCCSLPPHLRGGTPDLDCLRWITPQLMSRPEGKKVLFVICDGQPETLNSRLTCKLQASYKRYLENCKLAGIKTFGFGIESDLSEYFGEDWALVTPTSLANTFVQRLRLILHSTP